MYLDVSFQVSLISKPLRTNITKEFQCGIIVGLYMFSESVIPGETFSTDITEKFDLLCVHYSVEVQESFAGKITLLCLVVKQTLSLQALT